MFVMVMAVLRVTDGQACAVRRGGSGCGAGEQREATSVSDEGVDVWLRRGKRGVSRRGLQG